jgi:HlyD family secretion protein
MKRSWATLGIIAAAAGLIGARGARDPQRDPLSASTPVASRSAALPAQSAETRLGGSGILRAEIELRTIAPFAGTVKEIFYAEGDTVAAGVIVAVIESKELLARLKKSEADVTEAEASLRGTDERLSDAEKRLAEKRGFFRKDLIARRDVEEAQTAVETLRAEKDLAQAQLRRHEAALAHARYQVSLARIAAPVSGIVTRTFARPGEYVGVAGALLTIANTDALRVSLELPEMLAVRLEREMKAEISSKTHPARVFSGTIVEIAHPSPAVATRAVEVRVGNRDRLLKPGMEVTVSFPLGDAR